MNKVKAVTAWTPAGITSHQYPDGRREALLARLTAACDGALKVYDPFPWGDIWLVQENPPWKAANMRAVDRFPTDDDHIKSNIIQHWRTQAAMNLLAEDPTLDVIVWLDYGVMKQGAWRNNPVTEDHIRLFLQRIEKHGPFNNIPFPGIEARKPVSDTGDNWRFVGSTHIWPTRYLPAIHRSYVFECRRFIRRTGTVPLDLAIWPAVEANSGLPFQFYQAEYDASQFTGFSGVDAA